MTYEELLDFLGYNLPLIFGIILLLFIVLMVLTIVLVISNRKLKVRYNLMMKDVDKGSIEDMITHYQEKINHSSVDAKIALEKIDLLNKQISNCVQKVGVVRYQAFEDVGSDLSYSVALLDDKNDGVVITSIFGRNMSTSYAKPIANGVSRYAFSDEETYAINRALGLEKKEDQMNKKKAH